VGVGAAMLATFSFGRCVVSVSANAETNYIPLLGAAMALALTVDLEPLPKPLDITTRPRHRCRHAGAARLASGEALARKRTCR